MATTELPDNAVPDALVTIGRFDDATEAHLARAMLEPEGVPAFVADTHVINAYGGLIPTTFGDAKLQVRQQDVPRADAILRRRGTIRAESIEPFYDQRCPKCGSAEVRYSKVSRRWAYLSILLLGFPLMGLKRQWRCESCGFTWTDASPTGE